MSLRPFRDINKKKTKEIKVGTVKIGGNNSISVLHLHGTRDMSNRFHGDIDNKDKWGAYISVEKSVKFWVDKNKCMKTSIDTLPDLNEEDGSFIIRERYEE